MNTECAKKGLEDVSARRTSIPDMRPSRRLSKAYWYPSLTSFKTSQQGVLVSLKCVLQDVSARRTSIPDIVLHDVSAKRTGIPEMRPSRRLSKAYSYPWHRPPRHLSKAYWYPRNASFKTSQQGVLVSLTSSSTTSQQSVLVSLKCVLQDVSARRTGIPDMHLSRRPSKAYWYHWHASFKMSQQSVLVSLTCVLHHFICHTFPLLTYRNKLENKNSETETFLVTSYKETHTV